MAQSESKYKVSMRGPAHMFNPKSKAPLIYLSSHLSCWKWSFVGLCMCWQSWFTIKIMSRRVIVRYWSALVRVLYLLLFGKIAFWLFELIYLDGRELSIDFARVNPTLSSRLEAYCCWESWYPCSLLRIWIPRNRDASPMCLTLNFEWSWLIKFW